VNLHNFSLLDGQVKVFAPGTASLCKVQ